MIAFDRSFLDFNELWGAWRPRLIQDGYNPEIVDKFKDLLEAVYKQGRFDEANFIGACMKDNRRGK